MPTTTNDPIDPALIKTESPEIEPEDADTVEPPVYGIPIDQEPEEDTDA